MSSHASALPELKSTATGDPPELLPFHPSANVFDLMDGEEFDELVGDIQRRGLRIPIVTYKGRILDGRNRALACAKAGVPLRYQEFDGSDEDVDRFIISANIHRRHLTKVERHEKLAQLLKLHPEQSDRALAAKAGVGKDTVRRARKRTGANAPVGKRTGKDGRSRRMPTQAKKPKTAAVVGNIGLGMPCGDSCAASDFSSGGARLAPPEEPYARQVDGAPPSVAPLTSQVMPPKTNGATISNAPSAKAEPPIMLESVARTVGPESEGENARLQTTIDEMQTQINLLNIKLTRAEREVRELREKLCARCRALVEELGL